MAESTSTIPVGLCQCGCGRKTRIAHETDNRRGWRKGHPVRYVTGHNVSRGKRTPAIEYIEEHRGYSSPCWIWQGHIGKTGYGKKSIGGGIVRGSHIVYYEN